MTPAEYVEWWHYSGTGLGTSSEDETFEQLRRELSVAGANVVIVTHFLQACPEVIDLSRWRGSMCGYRGAQFRLTIEALDAIGAKRTASALRDGVGAPPARYFPSVADVRQGKVDYSALKTALDASRVQMLAAAADKNLLPENARDMVPPHRQTEDIETREEIVQLLEAFTMQEQEKLAADIAEHGDPRQAPGFDLQRFQKEQERQHERLRRFRHQRTELPELRQKLADMKQRISEAPAVSPALQKQGQKLLNQYCKFAQLAPDDVVAPLQLWLRQVEQLRDERPDVFCPKPTEDEALNARLAAIGRNELHLDGPSRCLSWRSPAGFECDWTQFELSFDVLLGKKKPTARLSDTNRMAAAYASLIEAWERFRLRFRDLEPQLKQYVLDTFREIAQDPSWYPLISQYENSSGEITEEAILSHVGSGSIVFSYNEGVSTGPQIHFDVDWDPEHGQEVQLDANGEIVRWF